jgi:peptidoglycan/xylan/chitin deacetylase (PgdA/CDA1 family)
VKKLTLFLHSGKRLIKMTISLGFAAADRIVAFSLRLAGRPSPATCVVLCYHSVPAERLQRFRRQIDEIVKRSKVIGIEGNGVLEPGAHHVAITVDDAFTCALQHVAPTMAARNIPFHLFVPAGWLGKRAGWWWDVNSMEKEMVMSADQLRTLAKRGVSIGSHSLTHQRLLHLDEESARKELNESRKLLADLTGREVTTLSFPYGEFDNRLLQIARESGYRRVFSLEPRCVTAGNAQFVVPRIDVDPRDWPLEFRLKLRGYYSWTTRVTAWKARAMKWLGRTIR